MACNLIVFTPSGFSKGKEEVRVKEAGVWGRRCMHWHGRCSNKNSCPGLNRRQKGGDAAHGVPVCSKM